MDKKLKHLLEVESAEIERDPDAVRNPGSKAKRSARPRVLQVRLSQEEYDRLEHAASEKHLPASTYARSVLLDHG